ncbi:MAG: alpha-L-fucosidase [Comamonadaceae bacterium]|nr:alpha-L-fucosidase [Comamonadaceae bacterium]
MAVVSKGGNYLLNVGPTGEGVIPGPSVEILRSVGEWMHRNGESIYGTSPSPFPAEPPWGFCTRKGDLLYLHVFDWPADGILRLEGLKDLDPERASLLTDEAGELKVGRDGRGRWLDLFAGFAARPRSTPSSSRAPPALPISIHSWSSPSAASRSSWTISTASTRGRAVKRFNRRGEEGEFHIAKMAGPADAIEWRVKVAEPGTYGVSITYAARPGWDDGRYTVSAGRERDHGRGEIEPGLVAGVQDRGGSGR